MSTIMAFGQPLGGGSGPLTPATTDTLGGIKVGNNLAITLDGTLSANAYTLPAASGTVLGGVKVGSGLNVLPDGTLSAAAQSLQIATADTLGGIRSSASVVVNGSTGVATVPLATTSVAGLLSHTDKQKLDYLPLDTTDYVINAIENQFAPFTRLIRVTTGAITASINCAIDAPQNIIYRASTISGNVQIANPTNGIEGQVITWHGMTSGTGSITFANLFRPQFGVSTINYTSGQVYIFTALFTNNLWHINWSTY